MSATTLAIGWPPSGTEWTFFAVLAVILAGPLLAQRIRLPGLIGLILGGLLIGPNVLDLVQREGFVEQLGSLGILYLMFMAGLELDLDDFRRNRTNAIRFGLLTFTIPITLGILVGLLGFDYGWAAAILFGSLWASHTLVAYPIARAAGLGGDRSVSMAVSGTVMTDTLALFVLALVVGIHEGSGSPAEIVLKLLLGLAVLVCAALLVVPRIARWFFAGPGQEGALRFVCVLAAFTGCAFLADAVGMEGIVGAFFAGLGLNRLISDRSPLAHNLEFYGSTIMIPFFLVSTGMLIDPSQLVDARTLALAGGSLAVVLVGKALAAILAGRLAGFSRESIAMVFSLSVAQAAATLAAVIVGLEAGIFDADLVNAALVVVLASLVIATLGAAWAAPRMTPSVAEAGRLGRAILVPVTDASTNLRVRLAARLAGVDRGVVMPIAITPGSGADGGVEGARARVHAARDVATALAAEVEPILRVDDEFGSAVVRAVQEHGATLVIASVAGARSVRDRLVGSPGLPTLLAGAGVPVLAVAPGADDAPAGRVVLALAPGDLAAAGRIATTLAADLARRLAHAHGCEVRVLAPDIEAARPVLIGLDAAPVDGYGGSRADALALVGRPGDLVVVPATMRHDAVGPEIEAIGAGPAHPTVVVVLAPFVGRERGVLAVRLTEAPA